MTSVGKSIVTRRRGVASRFACLPAVLIFGFMAAVPADRGMAAEGGVLLGVCLVQTLWPTLLGWAVLLSWFAFTTAQTIELTFHPGYSGSRAVLPVALVVVPLLFLVVLRPRVKTDERVAPAVALMIGLVAMLPLFTVWWR